MRRSKPEYPEMYHRIMRMGEDLSYGLQFLAPKTTTRTIAIEDIEDQKSLKQAVDCAATMKRLGMLDGIHQGLKLGVIDPTAPDYLTKPSFLPGQSVLFEDHENGTASVHVPYCQEAIRKQIKAGSLNFDTTICNVPIGLIRRVSRS